MHITELRIAGFKSFVDPQDLPIEPGLTGVVGPNGCGKSNLLEALRWAMGASSAKAMRGGEMDDLIFSGADGRPARETAEVTLVLDNTRRLAPAEFNTADVLEVTRRLKRGGGSTYRLNGRTVRGKDIQLLFADASTGANSPALVRQGQISELIASKPQNRRRILEDAAGISGLNTRRHEAELKLKAAESNLERLADVSAEVERQLEGLKRQARKARKYAALSEEIASLEAYVAHLKWQAASTAEAEARAALDTARTDVERLTRAAAVAETERLNASEGLQPLREAEQVASAKLGQARIALARLEAERQSARDTAERLQAEQVRLAEDIARERAARDEAEEALARTAEELATLPQPDPEALEAQEARAREALDAAAAARVQAQSEADAAQARVSDLRAQRDAAEQARRRAEARIAALRAEVERLTSDLEALPDADALRREAGEAVDRVSLAEHRRKMADDAVTEAEDAVARRRADEAREAGPRDAARSDLAALDAEIAGLERLLAPGEDVTAPPVVDRVRAAPGYETAVAAALGDDLQAPTDTTAPLYWSHAGRATDDCEPLPAGATPLSDRVTAPPELAARLARCGVVEASDGPRLAAMLRPGQRLVSPDGHLWRWDGFVRTPRAGASGAERLAQQARLDAARAERPALAEALSRADSAHAAAREALRVAEARLTEARKAVAPAQAELDAARRVQTQAEQVAARAELQGETATAALARARADLSAAGDGLEPEQETETAEALTAAEAALRSARERLETARDEETEARGRLNDLTRDREQTERRRAALEREQTAARRRLEAADSRLTALAERDAKVTEEARKAAHAPEALDADLSALAARVEGYERDRKAAADALAEREAASRAAETAAREAVQAASGARESLAAARVKLEGAEARLADCVAEARESFQRTPEGLLTLARAGLDAESLAVLDRGEAERRILILRRDRDALGGVNMDAEAEAEALAERLGTQAEEKADLEAAIAKLRQGVDALNAEGRERLMAAFETVDTHFQALFRALFQGGQAELKLIDAEDPLAAGLEIMAQPPGKRLGTLSLMSGGEQALTAAALIFAVFLSRPAPICVLDEVDAPLDDANVDRFCRMLDEMRSRTDTRFVVITHNAVTMSRMDRLFGVTMRERGVSKLVSVDLGTAEDLVAAE